MTFDKTLVEQAKDVKSAEELLKLAKDNNIEMTAEEAENYYNKLHSTAELADDELENVSGGGCSGGEKIDEYYYRINDEVYFDPGDGVVRKGRITWKGYVSSMDEVRYEILYGSDEDGSCTYCEVNLSQIRSLYSRLYDGGRRTYYD